MAGASAPRSQLEMMIEQIGDGDRNPDQPLFGYARVHARKG